MEKQTVFIKVKTIERLPSKKDTYLTDWGVCNFDLDTGKFSQIVTQNGCGSYIVELKPSFWLEEIELPSEEEILEVAPKTRCVNQFWDGANYVLNKLKGGNKQW